MKKTVFYIGANNVDKMVDKAQVATVLDRVWDCYTLVSTIGAWKGKQEESLMVVVWSDHSEWISIAAARRLCVALEQESIGFEFDGRFRLVDAAEAASTASGTETVLETVKAEKQEKEPAVADRPLVAAVNAVEVRFNDGDREWWLHCEMQDGSRCLFDNVDEETYKQLHVEAAAYGLARLATNTERRG